MEEKAKSYLSVKDIARIKSRHEETIRRWINTNKIEVPKFNSKKEGYSIPIESLIQSGILTKEEVDRYLHPNASDPRTSGKEPDSSSDWRSLIKEKESAQGEDLLLLITELNRIAAEYSRKKKQAEEQILQLKNQIVELEFQASSLESENRQIQDHITFLRGRL